jgi:hypothetical protein
MPNENEITLPIERYTKMRRDIDKLRALEAAGVDNWEGYSYAMEILAEEEE